MVIVHDSDKYKYFDKQRRVEIIKYINGVKKIYEGQAIYLPRRIYDGENVFSDIFNLLLRTKTRYQMSHLLLLQLQILLEKLVQML